MTWDNRDPKQQTIRSVQIAFDIIETLQEKGRLGVTDLAQSLDHSKSTVHSHLKTLESREMIVREGDKYRLSIRILKMALSVRDQVGNFDVIQSEVDALAEETGEIAQFGLEEHGKVRYLHKKSGELAVETASMVGAQQPMHSTSLGKTILAFLPEERTEEIIEELEFERRTADTHTSPEELREDLEKIAERGYGVDDEENIEGLRCVAAPVNSGDAVLGAVSLSGPASRFTPEHIESSLSDRVQRAANVIELNTKFS